MLAGAAVGLVAQVASLDPSQIVDADAIADVLGSSFGRVWTAQVSSALLLWVLIAPVRQGSKPAFYASLALAALLAVVDTSADHSSSSPISWLAVFSNVVHVIAMALWLASLAVLYGKAGWQANYGTISGRVTFSNNGAGVALASVVAISQTGPAVSALTNSEAAVTLNVPLLMVML